MAHHCSSLAVNFSGSLHVYIYIYIYIIQQALCATYRALDSCFDHIWSHQQCIPPLEMEPATTEYRAESLLLSHWSTSHTSDAKLTSHGKCATTHTHTHTHTSIYIYIYISHDQVVLTACSSMILSYSPSLHQFFLATFCIYTNLM